MSNTTPQEENAIFCDLSVFTDEQREQHTRLAQELFGAVTELREADEGYALRLPDDTGIISKIAAFINDDRHCCAFIHFGMEVEPFGKGIWLTLKGGADVKAAIKEEMISLIPDNVTTAAGL
jgi:hypothetical protein